MKEKRSSTISKNKKENKIRKIKMYQENKTIIETTATR